MFLVSGTYIVIHIHIVLLYIAFPEASILTLQKMCVTVVKTLIKLFNVLGSKELNFNKSSNGEML